MANDALHLTLSSSGPAEPVALQQLELVAEFENRGKKPRAVVIDATPLSHGSYDLEFTDAEERPVRPPSIGMCGMMSPLQEHEIVLVEAGKTFQTPVHAGRDHPGPGVYRIRVRYAAYQSDHGRESLSPVVISRLKHLWTGTLLSNWITLTLHLQGGSKYTGPQ